MREAELLFALSQADGGVQINCSRSGVTVFTRYFPTVKYKDATLFGAAFEVAAALQRDSRCPPGVKEALAAYDQHTAFLET